MNIVLFTTLFFSELFSFAGNPYFYDQKLSKETFSCVSNCYKKLYEPVNRITIDPRAEFHKKSVVFITFDPRYNYFSIGIDEKTNYFKCFFRESHTDPLKDKDIPDFIAWAVSIIKLIIHDETVYIYYSINKSQAFENGYSDETIARFSSTIKSILQEELPSCIDIKYNPEYLETYIGTKNNVKNGCLETECITLNNDKYIFITFLQKYFLEDVKEQLNKTIKNYHDSQIEELAIKYIKPSRLEITAEERRDLFVLSIFKTIKESSINNDITEFQEDILIKILRYLTNKKACHKLFPTFFEEKTKDSIFIDQLLDTLMVFKTEKHEELAEIGLNGIEHLKPTQRAFIYLNAIAGDQNALKPGRFIVDIFKILSTDIDTLAKILLSENRKQYINENNLRTLLLDYAQKHWFEWTYYCTKYIQGEEELDKQGVTELDFKNFRSLMTLCIDFAVENNPKDHIVSNYLLEKAEEYYMQYGDDFIWDQMDSKIPKFLK
ncbi:hypothetical protein NGRA_1366 [Nosema granulosis]|uniref:Uncharacterized protein n=1 Tax=Nosema granulosis TaxID=83296 RepID=A0A9P6GZ32_9MICR|nr:hypothetical protein NGRA_1366 [Nosema granulosis]